MRILIDPSVFRHARCGLTRYYGAVCDGLRGQGAELVVPLVTSNCDFKGGSARYTGWLRRIPKAAAAMDAASAWLFRCHVQRDRYDCILLTSPQFDASFLRKDPDVKFVMVVHDLMTCVTAPDGLYDVAGPGLAGLLSLAARANRIVCISNDTRNALLSHGVVDPDRVVVIRTGNLLADANVQQAEIQLPERFLLFVGERSGRKGFFSLVHALKQIMAEEPDLRLICTGQLSPTEIDYLQRHGIADRVQAIVADDRVLVALYRQALCLIYPSLYEGFGLPVIEAMHYGCPVITTRQGALAEVAGEAAIFVDPFDLAGMENAIRTLLHDPSRRQGLTQRGYLQAATFETASMMRSFYETLTFL